MSNWLRAADLTSISGELTQLHLVLDQLKDDASVGNSQVIPESLQAQILSIVKNCSTVIGNLNNVLQKHSGKSGAVKWVAFGKAEVAGLRMSLEAHRGSLSLVLELVSVSMSKAILDGMRLSFRTTSTTSSKILATSQRSWPS